MSPNRLVAEPSADIDIESAYAWYEKEQPGLGKEFLDEVRAVYDRIAAKPSVYQNIRSGIRRALVRRFP